jgi:serine protease Do
MIYSGSGGYMGLSFATPIDVAMKVAGELRAHGRVVRGRLGIRIQELTADLAASFGLKSAAGALVAMVEKGSPAEKAGLLRAQREALEGAGGVLVRAVSGPALKAGVQQGDIIVAINDTKVERIADFNRLVGKLPSGSSVALLILRRGVLLYVAVRLPN